MRKSERLVKTRAFAVTLADGAKTLDCSPPENVSTDRVSRARALVAAAIAV